ncbi:hypothetical protein [Pseudoclavibacter sp. RFBA6]|uniref:hypothetical protein n=1 Tax=Pseudoclavibacter sp. RFBA6 TaxID=2080573 RepID=UPI000CE873DF|nr:hypothetical protein [Pseudoclavibacter sp. RFBA6]PPG41502.1 hypothetical protein C5C17_05645 [Pseudoclavibacter sp. RFBA6]
MTLDDRGRTMRMWILASVIALVLAALATWLFFPLEMESYCGRVGTGPETCLEARSSAVGLPTSISSLTRAVGAAVATPFIVVVVIRYVRKQRALRAGGAPRGDSGAQSA